MGPDDNNPGLSLIAGPDDDDSLDLGDMDLSVEGEAEDLEFDGDDFSLEGLSFVDDMEEDALIDDLDLGAELLFTESDLSSVAYDYYKNLREVQEKIQPPAVAPMENFKINTADFPYLDPRFIEPLRDAIYNQAQSQAYLRENERMSAEENAEEVFNVLSSALPFHIGAYYNTFIEMCSRKYENFLKMSTVSTAQSSTKFEQLLDRDRMEVSQFVFELNGFLWHQITIYLSDDRINRSAFVNFKKPEGTPVYNCGAIGAAMEGYNEYLRSVGSKPVEISNMTVGNLLDCVNYTLSYRNMAGTLHLSQDDVTLLSVGELLRRYVLLEKDEELLDLRDFKPVFKELNSVTATGFERANISFSQDPQAFIQQLMPLYMYLCEPFYREGRSKIVVETQSITHELLYYLFVILDRGIADYKNPMRTAYEYLAMLTKFMVSLMLGAPYVRPVVYFTPNPVPDKEGEFELNFYYHNRYYSVREKGLLINVVGDQRSAYLIPFVAPIDRESRNVTCPEESGHGPEVPPSCVVFPLHQLFLDLKVATKNAGATSKKLRIDGTTEYRYTPSLAWVVSRSYSSQQDIDDAHVGEQHVSRTSNPLLNTLLCYTNKFYPERFNVAAVAASIESAKCKNTTVLYLQEVGNPVAETRLVSIVSDGDVVSDRGTLSYDENDGALVMRFFRGDDGETLIVDQQDYSITEYSNSEERGNEMPDYSAFVRNDTPLPDYSETLPELRSINKRLCTLNALDYKEELESVRTVIMRDLQNVVVTYHVDTLLAGGLLSDYLQRITTSDGLDYVNFESVKALVHIILGDVPVFDDKTAWDEECAEVVNKAIRASATTVTSLCIYLDQFDSSVLALQGLSNSETSNVVDRSRYMALHALPGVHVRLRMLEEKMLLLRVLNEIGSDIAPILRKRSPLLTAYNDVTTADNLDDMESSLKSGMKGGKQFDAFPLTRKVLNAEVGGSTPILKYFALERNVHGIMATAAYSEDEQEKEIYARLYATLGLGAEGMPQILQMDERAFMNAPFAIPLETACSNNRGLLLKLIERGLLADTSARIDLHVIKAFDLIMSYGTNLFEMRGIDADERYSENFEDTGEYMDAFYSYVGSFLVSYCFLQDEAVVAESSSSDRVVAFRSGATGFTHAVDMSKFAPYDLSDLRTVISE